MLCTCVLNDGHMCIEWPAIVLVPCEKVPLPRASVTCMQAAGHTPHDVALCRLQLPWCADGCALHVLQLLPSGAVVAILFG